MTGTIRALVADAHAVTRAGVRRALTDGGVRVVAEAATGPAAVEASLRERPDVCILDTDMPGGIAAAAAITDQLPGTAVVMLTASTDDADLFAALKAGASGYLLKDMNAERLPNAVRGVLAGEAALPRTLVARVLRQFRGDDRRPLMALLTRRGVELTSREWEVLELLRDELTTAQIASRLGVAPVTVRRHVSSILAKLRLPDRNAVRRLLDEDAEH
jgi:two-component system, NarL family, nitrate/nitrite response regulator NarL